MTLVVVKVPGEESGESKHSPLSSPGTFARPYYSCVSVTAELDVAHLVLVFLLGIAAHQQLHGGPQVVLVEPHLRVFGVEPHQLELGIVLATLVPGGNERIPEFVDDAPVIVESQLAVQRG